LWFIRVISIDTPPDIAFTCPSSDEPAPKGTIGAPYGAAAATMPHTSSVLVGKTTISGSAGGCHDSPWL
jgi:hypothetical protein